MDKSQQLDTLDLYTKAVEDWSKPASIHNSTESGFCTYFQNEHGVEYNKVNFPELYAYGETYEPDLFYQFPSTGLFPTGRNIRLSKLKVSLGDRLLKKSSHFNLKHHYITRPINDLRDLENIFMEYPSIFVSDWGKLMSCDFFRAKIWTDKRLLEYIDKKSFWIAERKDNETK